MAALSPKHGLRKPQSHRDKPVESIQEPANPQPDNSKVEKPAIATITLTLKEPSSDSKQIEKSLEIKGNIELLNQAILSKLHKRSKSKADVFDKYITNIV